MIEKFLDPYEMKARIAPGLILSVAVLVDVIFTVPVLSNVPIFAATSVFSLALIYGLGNFARACGASVQAKLWDEWGGEPSTRFLRLRDNHFGDGLKASIRSEITRRFAVQLQSPDEEAKNPEFADREIVDAFRRVRSYLRQKNADGLWQKQNIEYGFCRNLLGCRLPWIFFSVLALAFALGNAIRNSQNLVNPGTSVGCLSLICAVYVGWFLLPTATKKVAEAYAESAWMAFLNVSQGEPVASQQTIPATRSYIRPDPAVR